MRRLDEWFDRIFVISLPTSTARRESVERQFARLGVHRYQIVNAIDGHSLDLEALRSNGTLESRELRAGEVACYLSHIMVYQESIDRGYEQVLVCEDDIVFSENANQLFNDYLNRMPADWDIIHFHSHRPVGSGGPNDRKRQWVLPGIYQGHNEGTSALCNALNRRCFKYLLDLALPIKYTIDGIANWPTGWWAKGYKGYIVSPFPCTPGPFVNDTNTRGRSLPFELREHVKSRNRS